jgi:hypothetical protein
LAVYGVHSNFNHRLDFGSGLIRAV